jgi:hypothetical protein
VEQLSSPRTLPDVVTTGRPAVRGCHDASGGTAIETTLWELANTIRDLSSSDDEAFAVLESMLAGGRISVYATPQLSPA